MLQKYGGAFFYFGDHIGRFAIAGDILPDPTRKEADQLTEEQRAVVIETLEGAIWWCNDAGLRLSIPAVKRAIDVTKTTSSRHESGKAIGELYRRLVDELDTTKFYLVESGKVELYETVPLFGETVADNLAEANYDIEEAGKCFALGRNTACVMHLMRALEVALKAVGHGVGLPNVVELARNSWGAALAAIFQQIGANDKSGDPAWTPEKSSFLKDARAHLHAVKVAWRDNAMHLEKKYDEKDAKRIYDAVKNFMEYLAEHLDQAGQFTT
jgi:hypothetical protein